MLSTRARVSVDRAAARAPVSSNSVLRAFIQQPRQTGAVLPSSPSLCRKLVEMAHTDEASCVVELGAGTGAVTAQILRHTGDRCRVISLEIDRVLACKTQSRYPAAEVYVSDAAMLRELLNDLSIAHCEAIVSSIPWANIDTASQHSILDTIQASLMTGGYFTTFTYVHSMWLPNAVRFYQALEARFEVVKTSRVVWANMPPAVVYQVVNP